MLIFKVYIKKSLILDELKVHFSYRQVVFCINVWSDLHSVFFVLNSVFHSSRYVNREYRSAGGDYICVGWQIILCDLICQVKLRSFVMSYH